MPRKKSAKTRFRATLNLSNVDLVRAKSAIRINIYERGRKLGEMEIGQGSFFWWGANRKKGRRFWWGRVAEILNTEAYGTK